MLFFGENGSELVLFAWNLTEGFRARIETPEGRPGGFNLDFDFLDEVGVGFDSGIDMELSFEVVDELGRDDDSTLGQVLRFESPVEQGSLGHY